MIRNLDRQLVSAQKAGTLVRVTRRLEAGWKAEGYVVAAGKDWFVLHCVEEAYEFHGYSAFRLRDVKELEAPAPHVAFVERVLRLRGLRRKSPRGLDASSTAALIVSAGKRFPLVTLHDEVREEGACNIGRVARLTATAVELQEILPGATWRDSTSRHRLARITRIDFDGPYERALALVGGAPPRPARS